MSILDELYNNSLVNDNKSESSVETIVGFYPGEEELRQQNELQKNFWSQLLSAHRLIYDVYTTIQSVLIHRGKQNANPCVFCTSRNKKTCRRVIVVLITACRSYWNRSIEPYSAYSFSAPDHLTGLASHHLGQHRTICAVLP